MFYYYFALSNQSQTKTSIMKKAKFTTVALKENQHLKVVSDASIVEWYCEGYTDGKRDKSLDGYYFKSEVNFK